MTIPALLRPRQIRELWGLSRDQWKHMEKSIEWTGEDRVTIGGGKPLYRAARLVLKLGEPKKVEV